MLNLDKKSGIYWFIDGFKENTSNTLTLSLAAVGFWGYYILDQNIPFLLLDCNQCVEI